jgi:hypothetical protein
MNQSKTFWAHGLKNFVPTSNIYIYIKQIIFINSQTITVFWVHNNNNNNS